MTYPFVPTRKIFAMLAAPVAMAGALAGSGPAAATAGPRTGSGPAAASAPDCVSWTGAPPQSPGTSENSLDGVTVLSPCDAWAVGFDASGSGAEQTTLIEHWDGSAWTVVPSPNPGSGNNQLYGVRAFSATSVWAVGSYSGPAGTAHQTLILHWNGTRWVRVPSPSPFPQASLNSVTAISAGNAWAVGSYAPGGGADEALIEHWNGTRWVQQPSPGPNTSDLFGVAAASAGDIWAVGSSLDTQALAFHCC